MDTSPDQITPCSRMQGNKVHYSIVVHINKMSDNYLIKRSDFLLFIIYYLLLFIISYFLFIMVWLCTSGELNAQAVGYRE